MSLPAPVWTGYPSIPVTVQPAAWLRAMPLAKCTLSRRWPSVT
jgi:hypothetical protein